MISLQKDEPGRLVSFQKDEQGRLCICDGFALLARRDADGCWEARSGAAGVLVDDLVRACAEADQKYPLRRKVKRVDVRRLDWDAWEFWFEDEGYGLSSGRPDIAFLRESYPSYDWSEAYCIVHEAPPAPVKRPKMWVCP